MHSSPSSKLSRSCTALPVIFSLLSLQHLAPVSAAPEWPESSLVGASSSAKSVHNLSNLWISQHRERSNSFKSNRLPPNPRAQEIFGREELLDRLRTRILHRDSHIFLYGTGGLGKTTVAIQTVNDPLLRNKFSRTHFIPFDTLSINSADALVQHLLRLCPSSLPDRDDPLATLVDHLGTSSTFLVLDNFETLSQADSRGVRDFLGQALNIKTLTVFITTRDSSLFKEFGITIPCDRPILSEELRTLDLSSSRRLFLRITKGKHAHDESLDVLLNGDHLAGHSLSLELVAKYVIDIPRIQLALDDWAKHRLLSNADDSTTNDRNRSLSVSLQLSISAPRMDSGARDLLSLLAQFPGGFPHLVLKETGFGRPLAFILESSLAHTIMCDQFGDRLPRGSEGSPWVSLLPPVAESIRQKYSTDTSEIVELLVQSFNPTTMTGWSRQGDRVLGLECVFLSLLAGLLKVSVRTKMESSITLKQAEGLVNFFLDIIEWGANTRYYWHPQSILDLGEEVRSFAFSSFSSFS